MRPPQRAGRLGCLVSCLGLLFLGRGQCRPSPPEAQELPQLEALKRGILEALGMSSPPVPRQRASERELRRMRALYEEQREQLRRDPPPAVLLPERVQLLRTAVDTSSNSSGPGTQRFRVLFNRTGLMTEELGLVRAELKLYQHLLRSPAPREPGLAGPIQARVYQPPQNHSGDWALIAAAVLDSRDGGVDLRAPVDRWRTSSQEMLELEVETIARGPRPPPPAPHIVLGAETGPGEGGGRGQRHRRSSPEQGCGQEESRCCRKSLTVSFKEIGWADWVLAPETYTMYFCDGSCPHNYKPASMHTQIKSRMHNASKGAVPSPCCVPSAYDSMILMHYDSEGKLTLKIFNDMVVTKCHCA
ncbi:inhibin beta B chain [Lepisosteus oculatus]|uniref:Growth/differentiation factor 15 n=1 Tax=Lepisosteus oculatus TaxID=7918 RepID=W5LZX5_LEPOC|nr:PREDICTED: inhibin beta B chain-like [Lepisosteus oculatus]